MKVLNEKRKEKILDRVETIFQKVMFDINDETTRKSCQDMISEWMEFYKEEDDLDDYRVVCDYTNNPPLAIDRGELVVDLYLRFIDEADPIWVRGSVVNTKVVFQEAVIKNTPLT